MSKPDSDPNFDPMRAWRDWFLKNERDWSEAMTSFMKTDEVSEAMGKEVAASLFRQQMMTEGMSGPLAMMNVPTREDVSVLSDRIGRLEDTVARIEAMLTRMEESGAAKPSRTRKPPRKSTKTK